MAILIINRFMEDKIPYKDLLKKKNEELILITNQPEGFDGYDLKIILNKMNDVNIEFHALKLSAEYNITSVIAAHEFDLITAARIREKLNLNGQKLKSAIAFRDKIIMKDYAKGMVKVPKAKKINSGFDICEFLQYNGFPVVIKPIDGAGSENTFIINNDNELGTTISENNFNNYEIEEFINGSMYIVDGFVLNGKLVVSWASKYINGCLSYKEGKQTSFIQIDPNSEISKRLIENTKKLLSGMPVPNTTPIHAEFIVNENDEIFLCEIASRTGGAGIGEISERITGRHITYEWVLSQGLLGIEDNVSITNTELHGSVLIPPKVGKLLSIPKNKPFDWVKLYNVTGIEGMDYLASWSSVYSIINVLISGNSEEELLKRMDIFTEWAEEHCIWQEN